jgi:hypothetical protein
MSQTHNFKKLALHFVFPSFGLHLFGATEYLFDSPGDHAC